MSKYQPQSTVSARMREWVDVAWRNREEGDTLADIPTSDNLRASHLHKWANAIDKELADAYEQGYTDGALNPAGLQR